MQAPLLHLLSFLRFQNRNGSISIKKEATRSETQSRSASNVTLKSTYITQGIQGGGCIRRANSEGAETSADPSRGICLTITGSKISDITLAAAGLDLKFNIQVEVSGTNSGSADAVAKLNQLLGALAEVRRISNSNSRDQDR